MRPTYLLLTAYYLLTTYLGRVPQTGIHHLLPTTTFHLLTYYLLGRVPQLECLPAHRPAAQQVGELPPTPNP